MKTKPARSKPRTAGQKAASAKRTLLGPIYMLANYEASWRAAWSPEDQEDLRWAAHHLRRVRARHEAQVVVRRFRTRTGALRYPAWDRVVDVGTSVTTLDGFAKHAWLGGVPVCWLYRYTGTLRSPHRGTFDEQPHIDGTPAEHTQFCPDCLAAALRGGVLRGQSGSDRPQVGVVAVEGGHLRKYIVGAKLRFVAYDDATTGSRSGPHPFTEGDLLEVLPGPNSMGILAQRDDETIGMVWPTEVRLARRSK